MPVIALEPGYGGIVRDRQQDFNGVQLLFIEWAAHPLIACPITVPVPPGTRFGELLSGALTQSVFGQQPDWPTVDWSRATWRMNDAPFVPDLGKTLAEQGVAHKAFLTLTT
ncbi:phenol hydroxylase subunit P4 [Methylibium sp.]|uniref:phenol hydroxylase subunit P4 n=1 Tax=Methylibium sp. TaxID=2067992 RepID=UPI00286D5E1A|nr:phenol hydroxylase subunit P4 [Methylibium sp.]